MANGTGDKRSRTPHADRLPGKSAKESHSRKGGSQQKRGQVDEVQGRILELYAYGRHAEGFHLLAEAHLDRVRRSVHRRFALFSHGTLRGQTAEDVSQNALIRIHVSLQRTKSPMAIRNLGSWISLIISREICEEIRAETKARSRMTAAFFDDMDRISYATEDLWTHADDPLRTVIARRTLEAFRQESSSFSKRRQKIFVLHAQGYKLREIAALEGMTIGGVESDRIRGLERLTKVRSSREWVDCGTSLN